MSAPADRNLLRACATHAGEIFPRVRDELADARRLAAYLAVVELELPAPGVRRWLGWTRRDVDAACLDVEELREDAAIDEAIACAGIELRARHPRVERATRPRPDVADLNARRTARAARRALELLVEAGGQIVAHEAFGTVQTARTAICAARKEIGHAAIRTVRGRGFRMTEAGLRAARQLSEVGPSDASGAPDPARQRAAAWATRTSTVAGGIQVGARSAGWGSLIRASCPDAPIRPPVMAKPA
jgi:hypothetical protein